MSFSSISSNNSVRPADLLHHLVVIEVHAFRADFDTAYGPKDAVELTVHDIDTGRTYTDVLWFPTVIVGSLKSNVGQRVLVRIEQGAGRPGQQPPWVLKDESQDEVAAKKAEKYLDELQLRS